MLHVRRCTSRLEGSGKSQGFMSYQLTGIFNALVFSLTLVGLGAQLRLVWQRKRAFRRGQLQEGPTAILSLNQFTSSFLAFFSFFIYGACLERFNHYLVWPRLVASFLTLVVLWEIMASRRDWFSLGAFSLCMTMLVGAPILLMLKPTTVVWFRGVSQGFIVVVTIILGQGYLHQVVLMRQQGRTGAVSMQLHQFFLIKDISTVIFAISMGLRFGWPVLLLCTVSGITKVITLWHFRWARLSPVARQRRELLVPESDFGP